MGIISITTDVAGQILVNPRRVKIVTTDNLATVTTAGYLNEANLMGYQILPTDVIDMVYSYVSYSNAGTYEVFIPTISNGSITLALWANAGDVLLPVQANHIAGFNGTTGQIYSPTTSSPQTLINNGGLQAGVSGTAGTLTSFPGTASNGSLVIAAVNNSGNKTLTLSNISSLGQNTVLTFNDPGAATANVIVSTAASAQSIAGGLTISTGNLGVTAGNVTAGSSGHAGTVTSFPSSASNGSFIWAAVGNAGNFNATVSPKSTLGQATVYTIPDPGAATANFVLDAGTSAALSVNNLSYGATPVPQVDPGSCTITAAAGAANTCTITVQLKDGSGTNMSRVTPFKVYLATDNTGLTLQSAASTGYSVTSGGVKDPTGSTTITQGIAAFSSATGGCVLSLLDTGKGTGNLILMLHNGFKASAAITSGSYG